MKWIGQNIYDQVSKFRNTVDFSKDVTFYQPVNNADPQISIGSSDDERLQIEIFYQGTTTQSLQQAVFRTKTESGTANDGMFTFSVDEAAILDFKDAGIDLRTGMGIAINGVDILTDSSGTATLSNIDALDATTISTFNAALTAGDITGVTAGTNLSGGGTSGTVTINLLDATTTAKGAASFSSQNFAASSGAITIKDEGVDLTAEVTGVLPSANMDADTAHLSGTQSFTGGKTFKLPIISDGNRTLAPGDGAAIHVDAFDVTDGTTSASATAATFKHVSIEAPRLVATNSSVTTTDAATLYVKGAPVASTNQTITNAYALWVDTGNARFDGNIDLEGDIDVNGTLETDALTIAGATIAAIGTTAITTLGTIGTGTWNATAIASAKMATGTSSAQGALELATTAEATTGTDTARAVTPAGLKAYADRPAKQIVLMRAAFKDDIGTAKHYIPLQSELEQTAATHEMNSFVAPFAGKVLKLMYRGSGNFSGATFTFTLEKIKKDGAFATSGNLSTLETITATGPTNNATDPNMITVNFVGGGGTNAFAAGDNIMIGIQSDTDVTSGSSKHFFTLVTEFDFSGLA